MRSMAHYAEWLETDGLGGFASSTISGIHTRRYHGWLFSAYGDPGERWLSLSKLEDSLFTPKGQFHFSSNLYPGAIHPNGLENLLSFNPYPFPTFVFMAGNALLKREIFMVKGMPGVFVTYELFGSSLEPATLVINPLVNFRFYHHLSTEGSFTPILHKAEWGLMVSGHPKGGGILISGKGLEFTQKAVWYKNMLYSEEKRRGLDYSEDHFCPGELRFHMRWGERQIIWIGPIQGDKVLVKGQGMAQGSTLTDFKDFCGALPEIGFQLEELELDRRRGILEGAESSERVQKVGLFSKAKGVFELKENYLGQMLLSADSFVIEVDDLASVIAGYHWFGEWGRDTFISLPGLLLATRKWDVAKRVFLRFAQVASKGLIPNTFWEGSGAAYNSVDASLWYVRALSRFEKASGDREFVSQMLPVVNDIVKSFIRGTDNDVKMDSTGLLFAGSDSTQITWMDARVDDKPVTPRNGFPVEINALWIDALFNISRWLEEMSSRPEEGNDYMRLYQSARKEFLKRFLWPQKGLYDCIGPYGPSDEVRPNQVIAASMESLTLPRRVLEEVFHTALKELLTPFGLRTLSRNSPHYIGFYGGDAKERDIAYHQGSSWPFLLGFLFDLAKLLENSGSAKESVVTAGLGGNLGVSRYMAVFDLLRNFFPLDKNPCVTSIFELTSGDPPYERGGTVGQAWSVAEILRILRERDAN